MNRSRRLLIAAGGLLALGAPLRVQPVASTLPLLDELPALLREVRRARAPLLVLFSTPGCPFCREVRQNYLAPRMAEERLRKSPALLFREVDITASTPLVDADGRTTTHAEFAARFGVRVVPVVMLFDDRLQTLGEPLVGIDQAGFYEGFLQRAISEARSRLQR